MSSGVRTRLVASLLFLLARAVFAQEPWLEQSGIERWSRGEYVYNKLSTGQENGHEEFLLIVDRAGVRTLRATNAFIDRMEVWRHVVYRVDADFRPLDVYLNYNVDGQWRGSGFVEVGAESMEAVISGPNGMTRKTLPVPEHFSLIPHPIATNSWPAWYFDRQKGGSQPVTLYSFDGLAKDDDGMLGGIQQQTLTLVGQETVRVPAGKFECDEFMFGDGDPTIYLYGPDQLIIKMVWKLADVEYLLSALETGTARIQEGE